MTNPEIIKPVEPALDRPQSFVESIRANRSQIDTLTRHNQWLERRLTETDFPGIYQQALEITNLGWQIKIEQEDLEGYNWRYRFSQNGQEVDNFFIGTYQHIYDYPEAKEILKKMGLEPAVDRTDEVITILDRNDQHQIAIFALESDLYKAGIDTMTWGEGATKTVGQLQHEIDQGETEIISTSSGELLRATTVGIATVLYTDPTGQTWQLIEDRQEFQNGSTRRRNLNVVSEKMKAGEANPQQAMTRGIQEELGIDTNLDITNTGTDQTIKPSGSYPGLDTQYTYHRFDVQLTSAQFKPEGYTEVQSDKTTYFVWKRI